MKAISAFLSLLTLGATASLPVSLYPEAGLATLEDRQVAPSASGNHTCKIVGTDNVPCYYCDNDTCDVVKVFKVDTWFKFDCLCPNGQKKNGIR